VVTNWVNSSGYNGKLAIKYTQNSQLPHFEYLYAVGSAGKKNYILVILKFRKKLRAD
jgi:hypothetical protein